MLANIFKVKVPVESPDEGRERDQELGERRVHVHEEGLLDVFPCKAAKVDFVEATGQRMRGDAAGGEAARGDLHDARRLPDFPTPYDHRQRRQSDNPPDLSPTYRHLPPSPMIIPLSRTPERRGPVDVSFESCIGVTEGT